MNEFEDLLQKAGYSVPDAAKHLGYPFIRVGYILARCPNLPDHFNPLRSYRFDGMKPPEMSRQKFNVFWQADRVQRQFNDMFQRIDCLISTA